MLISKIEEMKNCGYFEDFSWPSSLKNFEKVNVIYGPNGSGKSSFARAFDTLHDGNFEDSKITLTVDTGDNEQVSITNHHFHPIYDRLFVYSDRFIEKGHTFRTDPALDSILTIGERTIEESERLDEIGHELQQLREKIDEESTAVERANKDIQTLYSSVSEAVVSNASAAGGRWKSRNSFSVRVVKKAFEAPSDNWKSLSKTDLDKQKQIINSPSMDSVSIPELDPNIDLQFLPELKTLLGRTPVSIILDTLERHPEGSSWVQQGLKLHADINTCIFCANDLTEERKLSITRHFSNEVKELQRELSNSISALMEIRNKCSRILSSLPDPGLLFADLRAQYSHELSIFQNQIHKLSSALEENIAIARAKHENVIAPSTNTIVPLNSIDPAPVVEILNEHNDRVSKRNEMIQQAAISVEEHYLSNNFGPLRELEKRFATSSKNVESLRAKIANLIEEQQKLSNREGDPLPTAETLTKHVTNILGRSELKFETTENGKQYTVTRNGDKAVDLSTGERSVIMLVYFMETVANYSGEGNPIVVIDDPVSSMDADVFMGVSTYIWTRTVTNDAVSQLFLLTHNFELFRQWDIQLDGARKWVKHRLWELQSRMTTSSAPDRMPHRNPELSAWPPSPLARTKVRSNYHHMFLAVANAKKKLDKDDGLNTRLEAQLLFPNVIRRLLETFLAFHDPNNVGNFHMSMKNAKEKLETAGYKGDADALSLRLTRYTHAYSHNDVPEIDEIASPDEIRATIAAVFVFLRALDEGHFRGMCNVLKLNEADLVREY